MLDNNCALLVVSCDKNIKVLNIFFDFFKKNWCECPFPVYLGMEKENPYYFGVNVLCSEKKDFSGRLISYIQKIQCKYILIVLDDFILEKEVCNDEILKYYKIISSDKKIANITLARIDANSRCSNYSNLMKKEWDANYLVNFQMGFWNADLLCSLLNEGENAWQAELFGSIRARRYKEYDFLNLSSNDYMPYVYNEGWLIVKGSWNGQELRRLHLESYADSFLDGKKILYSDFGRISRIQSVNIRIGVMLRKLLSIIKIYF